MRLTQRILFLFIFFASFEVIAQPVINSVSGTTSRCSKSGSLTASATGGTGTLQYSLIAPSVETRPNQFSNVFSALAPGKYTIRVIDVNSRIDTATYTVTGNYKIPTYTTWSRNATCSKATGALRIDNASGGRDTIRYRIVSGPVTRGWQTSSMFNNIPKGTYLVAATDSCGNTKNISVTVQETPVSALYVYRTSSRAIVGKCDSFSMYFYLSGGLAPYQYRLINGTDTIKFTSSRYVTLRRGTTYKYEVVDACGSVRSMNIVESKTLNASTLFKCDGFEVVLRPYYYGVPFSSTCMKYGVRNNNTNVTTWQNSNRFILDSNVSYTTYAVDTCCFDTFKRDYTFTLNPTFTVNKRYITNLDSTTGIIGYNYSTRYPYHAVLLETPYTSSDSFNTTTDQYNPGKRAYNKQAGDTFGYYNGATFVLLNMPKGKYKILAIDTCGSTDTLVFEILESDLWKKSLKGGKIERCPSDHALTYKYTSTIGYRPAFYFKQLSPSISTTTLTSKIAGGTFRDTIPSQNAGTYLFELRSGWGGVLIAGQGAEYIRDTVVVVDPGYPLLETPVTYTCKNGSSSILTKANDGMKPYKYRIRSVTSSTWSAFQNTGEFHNLTSGTYRIEVTDSCGNTNVISSSSGFLTAPSLKLGFTCDTDTLTLFGNKIDGIHYKWFKGTTQVSTNLSHSFKPYTASDYGTYKLQAYLNNSNGVCVDTSASITIGPNIEVRSEDLFACDSFQHKSNWLKKTGFFKDTLQSVGGCDSVANTKVYIGHKEYVNVDSVDCDSSYVFENWYYNSQAVYDTLDGRGYHLDTLQISGFETNPPGWALNNCVISSGGAKSGNRKLVFDGINDWLELPRMDYPDKLNFDYILSTLDNGAIKMKVQYFDGVFWQDIEEKDFTSSIYERYTFDLSAIEDSTNVRIRIKQSSPSNSTITYIDNFYVSNTTVECDTIIKVNLTINKSIEKNEYRTECDSALVYGEWFYSSQNILDTFNTYQGCDSFITTTLTINPTVITIVNTSVCDSGIVNGTMYYSTQLVKDSFTSYLDCDSVVHTNLIVNPVKRTYESQISCDSSLVQGKWYFTTQTINDTLKTYLNCDSIIITDLTVNYTQVTNLNRTSCDSSLIHGNWYFTTQEVRDTFRTYLNCDSVVVTDLTVNYTQVTTVNSTVCDSGIVNGNMYYATQLVKDSFTSYLNCDSVVHTYLTVNPVKRTYETRTSCDSSLVQGKRYFSTQTVYDTFTTYLNCDSIVITELTVNYTQVTNLKRTSCDSSLIHGNWYFVSQEVRDTFMTYLNCDSVVVTDLTVNYTQVTPINTTVCDSGLVNGNMYYTSQLVKDSFTSYLNCDSVVHTNLTVNPVKRTYLNQTSCDSSLVQGNWYYTTQTVFDTFTTYLNCDSIVITDLTVNYTQVTNLTKTSCDSSLIHGNWYFTTQQVRDTFVTYLNCDSVVVTDLTVNYTQLTNNNASVCDSMIINGNWYFSSQIVVDNLTTYLNCDSIVTTNLEVRNSFIRQYTDTFCKYYDYELDDGRIVEEPGRYQSIYTNIQNCDSIVEVNLIEKDCSPCTVFFPNAFTPNIDNKNDGFKREGTCTFIKYQLSIFNRWGELLYYTEDPDGIWDGSFNGATVQQGVYFYNCYYINREQKVANVHGDITLLK